MGRVMTLNEIRQKLERKKGKRDHIKKQISSAEKSIALHKGKLIHAQKGQLILQIVAQETQEQLEYRLNELVSLAQTAVFEDEAYALNMQFNIKRGKTEAQPLFVKHGKTRRPMYGTGFGAVDIAALILRPTLWSLEERAKRKRPTFIFDEPLRHLNDPTENLHRKASQMLRDISKKVNAKEGGIQMIIVTQNNILADAADKIFQVDQKNGKSFLVEG